MPTDPWLTRKKKGGTVYAPDPGTDPTPRPDEGGGGPDGGPTQPPPGGGVGGGEPFWQKMLRVLGVQKGTEPFRAEWGTDRFGWTYPMEPSVSKAMGTGWDTKEVWMTGSPETGYTPRYAEGQVPEWMQQAFTRFQYMKDVGQLTQQEMNNLADHWIRGVGIDPVWRAAYEAQPEYISGILRDFFRQLGATNV